MFDVYFELAIWMHLYAKSCEILCFLFLKWPVSSDAMASHEAQFWNLRRWEIIFDKLMLKPFGIRLLAQLSSRAFADLDVWKGIVEANCCNFFFSSFVNTWQFVCEVVGKVWNGSNVVWGNHVWAPMRNHEWADAPCTVQYARSTEVVPELFIWLEGFHFLEIWLQCNGSSNYLKKDF